MVSSAGKPSILSSVMQFTSRTLTATPLCLLLVHPFSSRGTLLHQSLRMVTYVLVGSPLMECQSGQGDNGGKLNDPTAHSEMLDVESVCFLVPEVDSTSHVRLSKFGPGVSSHACSCCYRCLPFLWNNGSHVL
ncbi:hypothetical protein SAY86_006244 [Trapa natans]|uniref:Uncharacterized protein n=1 Tax=Trapa natans TaxID=22666 RepID=A0AAN7LCX0_TRANT|nr:hypothetical protein SAY86_006244 [Trapa natans]